MSSVSKSPMSKSSVSKYSGSKCRESNCHWGATVWEATVWEATFMDSIKLGEKVRGKKFLIKQTTPDEATSKRNSNPENLFTNFMQEVFIAVCQGEFDYEPTLNKKCAQISSTTIEEFVDKWWGGKEGHIHFDSLMFSNCIFIDFLLNKKTFILHSIMIIHLHNIQYYMDMFVTLIYI